jgi:hypothetical protein
VSIARLRLVDDGHGVVDDATGEIFDPAQLDRKVADLEATIVALRKDVELAERDLRGKRLQIAKLLADEEAERMEYPRRAGVLHIIAEWAAVCNHPRAQATNDRFDCVRRLMDVQIPQPYTRADFSQAIAGAAYDCYEKPYRNGKMRRFDDLTTICKGGKEFDSFRDRAPKGWVYVPWRP